MTTNNRKSTMMNIVDSPSFGSTAPLGSANVYEQVINPLAINTGITIYSSESRIR